MAPASLLVMLLKSPSEIKNVDVEEDEPIEASTLIVPAAPQAVIEEVSEDDMKKLTYGKLLCKARIFFPAVTCSLNAFVYCVFEPTLSLRLQDYDVS